MLKYLFLFVFFCKVQLFQALDQAKIQNLLTDLIALDNRPTNLYIKSCWTLNARISFLKQIQFQSIFIDSKNYSLPIAVNPATVMFVIDLDCDFGVQFVHEINQTFLSFPYRWTMVRSNKLENTLLYKLNALTDSDIVIATWKLEGAKFDMEQFYKTQKNAQHYREHFGYWNETNGLSDERSSSIISRRRRNLYGQNIRVTAVMVYNDSLNHLWDFKERQKDPHSKINYKIVNHLLDTLNATKIFKFVNTWGYMNATTKRYNGMIADLMYDEADIAGSSLFIISPRVGEVEYISMMTPGKARFVFRSPPLSYVTNIYYLPFDKTVWLCSSILVVICCFIIYYTYKMAYIREKVPAPVLKSDIFLFAITGICQMGTPLQPKTLSGKISTIFFFMSLIFIYTSYTANIVSLLQSTTTSIRTLENLLHSSIEVGIEDIPYNRAYFSRLTGEVRETFYKTKIADGKSDKWMNISTCISKMRQGLFACHTDIGSGYQVVENTFYEHEKCGLVEIDIIAVMDPWLSTKKHSPFKEMAKVNAFKIREHGIQKREISRIYTQRPICTAHGQNFESVRLIDCYIILLILGYGFLFSIIMFLLEKLIYAKLKQCRLFVA